MLSLPLVETVASATSFNSPSQLIRTKTRTWRRREASLSSHAPHPIKNKSLGPYCGSHHLFLNSRRHGLSPFNNTRSTVSCTMDMTEGESAGPRRLNLDNIMGEISKAWESLPQPVRSFPWPEAVENFFELILGLAYAVVKYLSVPLLALTSLSELSYCAHERKMRLIPIPLLAGIVMGGILRDTILELYPQDKDAEFPRHLLIVASCFTLLKLPGPYYPYWGRIFLPHFANGGLLRSLWSAIMWYRRPPAALETTLQQSSTNDHQPQREP